MGVLLRPHVLKNLCYSRPTSGTYVKLIVIKNTWIQRMPKPALEGLRGAVLRKGPRNVRGWERPMLPGFDGSGHKKTNTMPMPLLGFWPM